MDIHLFAGYLSPTDGDMNGLARLADSLKQMLAGLLVPSFSVQCHTCEEDVDELMHQRLSRLAGMDPEDAMNDHLVGIGHSYGGDLNYRWMNELHRAGKSMALGVKLDAVPRWIKGNVQASCFVIPDNVDMAISYKRNWLEAVPPWSCEIINTSDRYINRRVDATHNGLPAVGWVQDEICSLVRGIALASMY